MLLDFNLARPAVDDGQACAELGGTLAYMAPEHLAAVAKLKEGADPANLCVDGRADVYALGLVLCEALGMRPLWPTEAQGSAMDDLPALIAARSLPVPRLKTSDTDRRVPVALGAVIRRCLEPDPADRYALAAELATDLQAVADNRPLIFAREPEPSKTLRRTWTNRHMLAGAVGVLALLTAIFAAQTAALRVESRARLALDAGIRSASAGEFTAAAAQFAMAHDRASTGSGHALRSLADLALRHKNEAVAAGQIRDRAEAFFRKVEPIRFRLITGRQLKAASQDLRAAFTEFKIFGPTLWTRDPDLDRLDPPRRAAAGRGE